MGDKPGTALLAAPADHGVSYDEPAQSSSEYSGNVVSQGPSTQPKIVEDVSSSSKDTSEGNANGSRTACNRCITLKLICNYRGGCCPFMTLMQSIPLIGLSVKDPCNKWHVIPALHSYYAIVDDERQLRLPDGLHTHALIAGETRSWSTKGVEEQEDIRKRASPSIGGLTLYPTN